MATEVKVQPAGFEVGPPKVIVSGVLIPYIATGGNIGRHYAVSADGQRFLVLAAPRNATAASSPVTVVLNWTTGLKH